MNIKHMTLKQCQRIIDNNFASLVGQSNDKYVNYKEEILSHYYNLVDKRNQKN